ncbi:MAG: phosphohistidine phosphatase SixA [Gemmataceae bacterium]|nr:phosphohistidine phosphatase SixA [Gemmataceae bacterium]
MDLYLIRHAEAVPLGERGITRDEDRPLTADGEQQAARLAASLQRRGVTLDLLLTSPLARARQTAEALARVGDPLVTELRVCEELEPGRKRKRLARALAAADRQRVGLVGHQPDLGEFLGWLVGDREVRVGLAKGGVACVRCDGSPSRGNGTLVWLVTPAWFD